MLQRLLITNRWWSVAAEWGRRPTGVAKDRGAESGGDVDAASGAELVDGEAAQGTMFSGL
jgi:hypothetical protein